MINKQNKKKFIIYLNRKKLIDWLIKVWFSNIDFFGWSCFQRANVLRSNIFLIKIHFRTPHARKREGKKKFVRCCCCCRCRRQISIDPCLFTTTLLFMCLFWRIFGEFFILFCFSFLGCFCFSKKELIPVTRISFFQIKKSVFFLCM